MSTMNIVFNIIVIIIFLKATRCSLVHDKFSQDTIYVSKYCPEHKYCNEGTHVMCMYYDRNHKIGPSCANYVKADVTNNLVKQILVTVNEIRSKVAAGTERGKDNVVLPKAYGMMRMGWDSELATLAQVLANQCLGGREDLCRATDNFPNPSQSIAIVQFKYPTWEYLNPNKTSTKGFNFEKLSFSLDKFLKSLYALKKSVSKEIVMNCPPIQELPNQNVKFYLNLIRGKATHIGCGMSAYTRYHENGRKQSIHNSVQIVCNISDRPVPSEPVYTTDPPIHGLGFSKRCGCPKGYRETQGCLCEIDPITHGTMIGASLNSTTQKLSTIQMSKPSQFKFPIVTKPHDELNLNEGKQKCDTLGNCEDKFVLLPILSIKDAPPAKMPFIKKHIRADNTTTEPEISEKIGYSEETFNQIAKAFTLHSERKGISPKIFYENHVLPQAPHKKFLKSNVITKTFQIPKDEAAGIYVEDMVNNPYKTNEEVVTENEMDRAQDFFYDNQEPKQNNDVSNDDTTSVPKNKGIKLLTILNILEQEVKNIELSGNLKHLFESKMRKIYGIAFRALREESYSKQTDVTSPDDIGNNFKDLNNYSNNKELRERSHLADNVITVNKPYLVDNRINPIQNYGSTTFKYEDFLEAKKNDSMDMKVVETPSLIKYEDNPANDLDTMSIQKHLHFDHRDSYTKYDATLDRQNDDDDDNQDILLPRFQETIVGYKHRDLLEEKMNTSKEIEYGNVYNKYDDKNNEYRNVYNKFGDKNYEYGDLYNKYNDKNNEFDKNDLFSIINRRRHKMERHRRILTPNERETIMPMKRVAKNKGVGTFPYSITPENRAQNSRNYRRMISDEMSRTMRRMRPNSEDMWISPRFPKQQPIEYNDREIEVE